MFTASALEWCVRSFVNSDRPRPAADRAGARRRASRERLSSWIISPPRVLSQKLILEPSDPELRSYSNPRTGHRATVSPDGPAPGAASSGRWRAKRSTKGAPAATNAPALRTSNLPSAGITRAPAQTATTNPRPGPARPRTVRSHGHPPPRQPLHRSADKEPAQPGPQRSPTNTPASANAGASIG